MTLHDRRSTDTLAAGQYAPVEVDDPYEKGATVVVLRQMRGDPLARLHDRGQIDEAQYRAGRRYQQSWEEIECGARAIDTTKERVDGGVLPEVFRESRRKAALDIAAAEAKLKDISKLIRDVLVSGVSIERYLAHRGLRGEWKLRVYGKRFRDGLDILAKHWGYSNGERNAKGNR